MMPVLVLLFFGVPLAEIAVLIAVGSRLGVVETIALMVGISIAGAWLAKRQGLATLVRIREELAAGRIPGAEMVDGLVILAAGLLLLTPGFITDAVALAALVPPIRAGVRIMLRRRFERRVLRVRTTGPWVGGGGVYETTWRSPGDAPPPDPRDEARGPDEGLQPGEEAPPGPDPPDAIPPLRPPSGS